MVDWISGKEYIFLCLNEGWREEWNGHLPLRDANVSKLVKSILTSFNRLVIFTSSETSYHGLPDAILCAYNMTLNSIAMYYYTVEKDPSYIVH